MRDVVRLIYRSFRSDLVILDGDEKRLAILCAALWLFPWLPVKIVSVDLILRSPRSKQARFKAFFKRILLKRVHRFILYFKDLRGYERFYGITPHRAIYVPFKVNGWERITLSNVTSDGSYVLCAGRTLRDVGTFVKAMQRTECPGILLQQPSHYLNQHGTEAFSGELPPNVKFVIDDSGAQQSFIDYLSNARLVVIPRFRHDIAASGIGTYLLAMALNKCVIISEGPGTSDVLTDQAVLVPAEDPERLAEQIRLLWSDDALRRVVAFRGHVYALSLKGEQRLFTDILHNSVRSLFQT